MAAALLKFEVTAVWIECSNCHVPFALTSTLQERLRADCTTFYCPNGHGEWYPDKTEAQKLREQLAEEKRLRERAELEASSQRLIARGAQIQKTKAQKKLKRAMTRVNAGVCPHCNRTFKQLAAHMKTKHPGIAPPAEEGCAHV